MKERISGDLELDVIITANWMLESDLHATFND